MILFPCAKINLGLNVVERRDDGYHNLETVFFPVAVRDALEVVERSPDFPLEAGCSLKVTGAEGLCDERQNLVVRAYDMLAADYALPRVYAHLHKGIPSQAGMGGGSSDAAYMIRLLDRQFSLGLTVGQQRRYAARLGADCAFFITADDGNPQPVYATGIGDRLEPFEEPWTALDGKWLLLLKPDVAVSTKEAYAGITPRRPLKNCREVLMQPMETWRRDLVNDFEESVFRKLPVLAGIKEEMYSKGAVYAAMSGSGSTIFGIFDDKPQNFDLQCQQIVIQVAGDRRRRA